MNIDKNNLNFTFLLNYFNNIIDYKNIKLLKIFLSKEGKIYSRKETGITPKQQNLIKKSIKRARALGLIPNLIKVTLY
jgi:ribosomal protein S18